MQPDEIVALITIVLVLAYGLSQAYTLWQRYQTTNQMPVPRAAPPPQPVQRAKIVRPRPYTRRSVADRTNEHTLIVAALAAGLDPAWLAKTLRGHPVHNRRRIAAVTRSQTPSA